ncbi:hypothetical protein EMCRGX_G008933 [Ephydatia muelleri]
MQAHIDNLMSMIKAQPVAKSGVQLSVKLVALKDDNDIESYLVTFELIMAAHKVEKEQWLHYLAPQLAGKAQLALAALAITESVKAAVDELHSYDMAHLDIRLPNICLRNTPEALQPHQQKPQFGAILGLSGEIIVKPKAAVSLIPHLDNTIVAGRVLSSSLPKAHPVSSTCVFACCEAQDTIANFHIILDRYKEEVVNLAASQWNTTTLSMGIFYKLHTLLEEEYQLLDVKLALQLSTDAELITASYEEFATAVRELTAYKEQLKVYDKKLQSEDTSPGLQLSRSVSTNKASFHEDTSPGLQLSTRVSTIVKLPFMKIRTLVHSIRDESLLLKFPFVKIRARDPAFKTSL